MVRQRNVVAADLTSARMMRRIVVEGSEAGEFAFPDQAARVDVHAPQHVGPFDEQPASGDLRTRPVAVSRQHLVVCGAAEPQDAQRGLHLVLERDDAVRSVAVLVRPTPGVGQRAHAAEHRPAAGSIRFGVGEPLLGGDDLQHVLVVGIAGSQKGRTAVGTQRGKHNMQFAAAELLIGNEQIGKIGRKSEAAEIGDVCREPSAVESSAGSAAADRVNRPASSSMTTKRNSDCSTSDCTSAGSAP